MSAEQLIYYILRIAVASVCGICIGIERSRRSKEAGVRTHCIVALGAALMMIISKYGFADMAIGADGMRGADGARIAAQVVSGIGFLGAGMIFVRKDTITGLTTAAGIWVTSGVGMAIGAGMYGIGLAATVIVILVQSVLHMQLGHHHKYARRLKIKLKGVNEEGFERRYIALLEEKGIKPVEVSTERTDGLFNYTFTAETEADIAEDEILALTDYDGSVASAKSLK